MRKYTLFVWLTIVSLIVGLFPLSVMARPLSTNALANTPDPSSVTIAGSLQSEAGCAGDWDPACAATHLTYDASDDVWQGTFPLPAGSYEYKAALNDSWTENYGLHAAAERGEHPLEPPVGTAASSSTTTTSRTGSPTTGTR